VRTALTLVVVLGCTGTPPLDPGLTPTQLTSFVRSDATDRAGWAADVHAALLSAGKIPDADHACQVLATIEQESGYEADPEVPGLSAIVLTELEAEVNDTLGFLGPSALALLIDVAPEGESQTFRDKLGEVSTERDLDLVFRQLVDFHEAKAPAVGKALRLVAPRLEERLNPISTAGSMQVNVGYAQKHPASRDLTREEVRDDLYTRAGGVRYGTLRLFEHEASYDDPIYRFADYNAGLYASRNAAFQDVLTDVTDASLAPDGDLLVYNKRGKPTGADSQTLLALMAWRDAVAPDLGDAAVRRQAKKEKSRRFEQTALWSGVRATYTQKHGTEPPYARVPDVALDSPKLRGDWTTATFAERVKRRYRDCLKRG